MKSPSKEHGFTIIELLVTMVIVAILSGLVISAYRSYKARVYNAEARMHIKDLSTATEAYFSTRDAGDSSLEGTFWVTKKAETAPSAVVGSAEPMSYLPGYVAKDPIYFSVAQWGRSDGYIVLRQYWTLHCDGNSAFMVMDSDPYSASGSKTGLIEISQSNPIYSIYREVAGCETA